MGTRLFEALVAAINLSIEADCVVELKQHGDGTAIIASSAGIYRHDLATDDLVEVNWDEDYGAVLLEYYWYDDSHEEIERIWDSCERICLNPEERARADAAGVTIPEPEHVSHETLDATQRLVAWCVAASLVHGDPRFAGPRGS